MKKEDRRQQRKLTSLVLANVLDIVHLETHLVTLRSVSVH